MFNNPRTGESVSRVVILLAEGTGTTDKSVPVRLARAVVGQWLEAGRPQDWLFVVTGKKTKPAGPNPSWLEAAAAEGEYALLRQVLRKKTVPSKLIFEEKESDNTPEQALFVQNIIGQEVLQAQVSLACHDIHASRAVADFRQAGYKNLEMPPITVPYHGDPFSQSLPHMRLPRPIYWLLEQGITFLRSRR